MTSLLPLLHLHDLVPVEAAHLQLPVEVPHRERHEVLVRNAALQGDTLIMKVKKDLHAANIWIWDNY